MLIATMGGTRNQITGPITRREESPEFHGDIVNLLNAPAYGEPIVTNINSSGGQITSPRAFRNYTPGARLFQLALQYAF